MKTSFNAYDESLQRIRRKARNLSMKISHQAEDNEALYRELFGAVGDNFEHWGVIFCEFGKNIFIGKNVYLNTNCTLLDAYDINIGDHVFIGPNVGIYTSNHAKDIQQRRNGIEYGSAVNIENDVWIGGHAVVLPGVTIGEGSIIGAGAIVSRSVPPFSRVLNKGSEIF